MSELEAAEKKWKEGRERDLRDYLATREKAFAERHPPYRVRVADQFSYEDDYVLGVYETLEQAIAAARAVTEKAIRTSGSLRSWLGMGEVGLVYDAGRCLVWSGLVEYAELADGNR